MRMMTMMAGAATLALVISSSGAEAQRHQGRRGGGDGPRNLNRTVLMTLDRAEILGLSADQVADLRALQDEVSAASEALRDEVNARREAQRAQRQSEARERAPLPADPEERDAVMESRREEMQTRREAMRAESREFRQQMAATWDPLIQRYEQLVPPSQRPRFDARAQRGQRGDRGERGVRGQRSRGERGQNMERRPRGRRGPGGAGPGDPGQPNALEAAWVDSLAGPVGVSA